MVEETVGDWVVIYENRKGAFGYVSVIKVARVVPDPDLKDHYFAFYEQGTEWQFEQVVPRNDPMGAAYETALRGRDGAAISGGVSVAAVRRLSFEAFSSIVTAGLKPLEGPDALPREYGFADAQQQDAFDHGALLDIRDTVLTSRLKRDASFARLVKAAYAGRCAISGLDLRNGGGRAEVQAAHIRPVGEQGPDVVINGLALSGTVHWMFDRGLISVGENYEILVRDNKVPRDVQRRLISPSWRLHLPEDPRHHPHQSYLEWHREHRFRSVA